MTTLPTDRTRLIRTLKAQLQCERFLGAHWLPIALEPQAQAPPVPTASPPRHGDTSMQQTQEKDVLQKQQKLDTLAQLIAQCGKCPLGKSRLNAVPGQGNPDARIVFVGEAPGQTEDQQGLAFVGRAGKLLTSIVEAMGLTRQDVYICNILKCRPPDNRDPQPAEVIACNDYLYEQLEIIQPEIIVALGAHAARTLLKTNLPIGQLRGRFHEYQPGPFAEPIKLIPTYHPAYLLRNYSDENRRRVWQDMQTVLRELNLPIPPARK